MDTLGCIFRFDCCSCNCRSVYHELGDAAANLVGVLELLAVFFLVFKNRFNENGVNLLTGSRVVPAMTAVLIALLVIAAILSVASVIVSYAVHSEEDAEGDAYWDDDDENRNAPTGLIDDNDTAPVTGSIPSASTAVATLIQMNTSKSFAIMNNTELVIVRVLRQM